MTNFQGGYPSFGYHLFEFELPEENMIITNDEEAYLVHQHYKKNKKMFADRLKKMPPNMLEFEERHQERLKIEMRMPRGVKIDGYLEKFKEIRYNYDFGDDWHFIIKHEEIVDDYYFGYPTLLDGAETEPPEDVGGIHGYYEFLEVYMNPKDPEHDRIKAWADSNHFREYDPYWINEKMTWLKYKKTEWDKINHERYRIIEDKYRKN